MFKYKSGTANQKNKTETPHNTTIVLMMIWMTTHDVDVDVDVGAAADDEDNDGDDMSACQPVPGFNRIVLSNTGAASCCSVRRCIAISS